jgi:WD40 repeat protein
MKRGIALFAESLRSQNRCARRIVMLLPGAFCALGILAAPLFGQYYYEKNKVQTQDYDFKTVQTAHFRIYFYPGGEELASYTARIAEEYYKSISLDLGIQQEAIVPIILYNSPNAFTETNVEQDIIEEAVGGFSEMFKNRVVVPFDGSYARFKKVLWHEITHIFQFELFYQSRIANILSLASEYQIPQWVSEGMAEYASGGVELGNEIFMRDLVINNRLLPIDQLSDIEGYLSYREGEAIFRYIEDHYGRKKVFEFVHELKNRHDVSDAFSATFGESSKKFSEEFEGYLRKKYWPQIIRQDNFKQIGKLLTDHVADGSVYNTSPAISPSGTKIAFISDRNEYSDIYVISAVDGKVLKHLISGERSGGFESVHPYRGGISWSPDESSVVLASKANGRDCLVIVAYPSGRILKRLFLKVDAIYSPAFAPDGNRIVFVGLKDGYSDLFVYNLRTGELSRKTADIYEDRDPSFSAGGDSILFVSDRPDGDTWQPGNYAVFVATDSAAPVRLTPRADYLAYPAFMPGDSEIAFVTSDSSYDLYVYSLAGQRVVQRTDFLGGVYYPTFSKDGDRLVLAYYDNLGWDIGCIKDPLKSLPLRAETLLTAEKDTETYRETGLDASRIKPYSFNLTPDYAIGQASYAAGLGLNSVTGTLDVAMSDELGNHNFYLTTDLVGDVLNSDFSLSWWYLPHRIDYGVGISQQFNYYYFYSPDSVLRLRDLGISGMVSYPFDMFTRLEFAPSIIARQAQLYTYDAFNDSFAAGPYAWYRILQPDVAFVFDNSYWSTMTAPERGTRFRAEAYGTVLSDWQYASALLDYRNYIKLGRRYVWANRLVGIASFGRDAEQFSMGGEWVRGYQYYEFSDSTASKMAVFSSELRFPFVDHLKLAFPLPIDLTDLRGVAFFDAGLAKGSRPVIYRNGELRDLKAGIGAGFRFQISYFEIKLDWGWPLSALSADSTGAERKRSGTWDFSLGTDF